MYSFDSYILQNKYFAKVIKTKKKAKVAGRYKQNVGLHVDIKTCIILINMVGLLND